MFDYHVFSPQNASGKTFEPFEAPGPGHAFGRLVRNRFLHTQTHRAASSEAYFNDAQRQSTKDAGTISGMNAAFSKGRRRWDGPGTGLVRTCDFERPWDPGSGRRAPVVWSGLSARQFWWVTMFGMIPGGPEKSEGLPSLRYCTLFFCPSICQ